MCEVKPFSSITSISPGSISLSYSASIRSKAQDSEDTTHESLSLPSIRGLKPPGSLTAIRCFSVRITSEYEPLTLPRAYLSLSTRLFSLLDASRCTIISVSMLDWNIDP
jgi:hypothetical protein